jgi:hypothetical protein
MEARQREASELAANKEVGHKPPILQQVLPEKQTNPTIFESMGQLPDLRPQLEGDQSLLKDIKTGYTKDLLFTKVLENIRHHKNFETADDLLYMRNCVGESVLCIPSVIQKKR